MDWVLVLYKPHSQGCDANKNCIWRRGCLAKAKHDAEPYTCVSLPSSAWQSRRPSDHGVIGKLFAVMTSAPARTYSRCICRTASGASAFAKAATRKLSARSVSATRVRTLRTFSRCPMLPSKIVIDILSLKSRSRRTHVGSAYCQTRRTDCRSNAPTQKTYLAAGASPAKVSQSLGKWITCSINSELRAGTPS